MLLSMDPAPHHLSIISDDTKKGIFVSSEHQLMMEYHNRRRQNRLADDGNLSILTIPVGAEQSPKNTISSFQNLPSKAMNIVTSPHFLLPTDDLVPPELSSQEEKQEQEQEQPPEKRHKSVSFRKVHIREHAITVGDNPNVVGGLPLSLDWKHGPELIREIDDFESSRRHCQTPNVRRRKSLTAEERKCRLRCMGITQTQLRQAEIQRKIRLTSEWAYGKDEHGRPKVFSVQQTRMLLQQYVV